MRRGRWLCPAAGLVYAAANSRGGPHLLQSELRSDGTTTMVEGGLIRSSSSSSSSGFVQTAEYDRRGGDLPGAMGPRRSDFDPTRMEDAEGDRQDSRRGEDSTRDGEGTSGGQGDQLLLERSVRGRREGAQGGGRDGKSPVSRGKTPTTTIHHRAGKRTGIKVATRMLLRSRARRRAARSAQPGKLAKEVVQLHWIKTVRPS